MVGDIDVKLWTVCFCYGPFYNMAAWFTYGYFYQFPAVDYNYFWWTHTREFLLLKEHSTSYKFVLQNFQKTVKNI